MTFDELTLQLFARQGIGAGLAGFSALLARLHSPHQQIKIIHVAGTNGKGSVCTLLARTLTCAGRKTGLFVSPHLVSPTERVSIDGTEIPQDDFVRCVQQVLACEKETLNFFEILTAAALVYFAEQQCEYAVLETGLGGRKDPTNVCCPVACVITSVGLDHTHLLGSTLAQIAADKAGIIKPGVPVFCGTLPPEARAVMEQVAATQKSPVCFVRAGEPFSLAGVDVARGNLLIKKEENVFPLHLMGQFQTVNACVVWHVSRLLGVSETAILRAFETVQLAGRFEVMRRRGKTLVIDGAHNPQAVEALLDFWLQTPYAQDAALVCGFMKDKDYQKMFALLAPHFNKIFLTVPPGSLAKKFSISRIETLRDDEKNFSRAAGENELRPFLARPGVVFVPDVQAALSHACASAQNVLCTGSFYLAGAVRKLIKGQ